MVAKHVLDGDARYKVLVCRTTPSNCLKATAASTSECFLAISSWGCLRIQACDHRLTFCAGLSLKRRHMQMTCRVPAIAFFEATVSHTSWDMVAAS